MTRVLQVLGSLQRGGAETMVMNVYRQIDRNKCQFDFLLKEKVEDGYEQEVRELGGHIYYVESPKKVGVKNYIKNMKDIMLKQGPYNAVHSHMNVMSGMVMVSAWMAGVKVRVSHSHSTKFPNSAKINFVGKALIKLFANRKAACGEKAGRALFGSSKFSIIPNGIDTSRYYIYNRNEKRQIRDKLGMQQGVLQICHVGRFIDVKNHDFIIEIAQALKQRNIKFQMHLLGNGELFETIWKKAKEQNLKEVLFHGSVNNVNEYLKAADIFILPSKYEGLPVTLVEAQSAGLSCLISDKVPTEVDFKIGLIKSLPLKLDEWVDNLEMLSAARNVVSQPIIEKAIKTKGYDIRDSARRMLELYL